MVNEKKWGVLCYLPVVNVVFCMIVAAKFSESKFLKFHLRQGTVLFGVWMLTNFVALVMPVLSLIMWVVLLLLYGAGMAIAYGGQMTSIPFIGEVALKIPEDYFYKHLTGGKTPPQTPQSPQEEPKNEEPKQ